MERRDSEEAREAALHGQDQVGLSAGDALANRPMPSTPDEPAPSTAEHEAVPPPMEANAPRVPTAGHPDVAEEREAAAEIAETDADRDQDQIGLGDDDDVREEVDPIR